MELALKQNNIIPNERVNNTINYLKNNKGSKLIMRLEQPFEYIILLTYSYNLFKNLLYEHVNK